MKAWKLLLIIASVFSSNLFAETYTYPLEEIQSLEISAGISFNVQCGDESKIEVNAKSEDHFHLDTDNQELKLSSKRQNSWFFFSWGNHKITANIILKNLPSYINVSSGSSGDLNSCYQNKEKLGVSVSSGSSLDFENNNGTIKHLNVDVSSGSKISLGNILDVENLNLDVSSGSRFIARDNVIIDSTEFIVSSGSSADICDTNKLTGHASSGSSVRVSRDTQTDTRTSSGSSIRHNC